MKMKKSILFIILFISIFSMQAKEINVVTTLHQQMLNPKNNYSLRIQFAKTYLETKLTIINEYLDNIVKVDNRKPTVNEIEIIFNYWVYDGNIMNHLNDLLIEGELLNKTDELQSILDYYLFKLCYISEVSRIFYENDIYKYNILIKLNDIKIKHCGKYYQ